VEQDRIRTRAVPEILHWTTRPIFWSNFLGKNFRNENPGTVGHYLPRDPRRNASCHGPRPRSGYNSARRSARHASLACQPSISRSWHRSLIVAKRRRLWRWLLNNELETWALPAVMVGTALFVLAIAFISYSEIKRQFDDAAIIAANQTASGASDIVDRL
jgi:hypothetical protein